MVKENREEKEIGKIGNKGIEEGRKGKERKA